MDTETKPSAPEPQQVGDHVVVHGDHPVDIGNGRTAPLQILLAHRNPHCRYCSEGFVTRHEGGKPITKVCACCVDRYRKKAAEAAREQMRVQALQVERVRTEREEVAARRREERLSREVQRIEEAIAERQRRFDEENAELLAAARSAEATAQDESAFALRAEQEVAYLVEGVKDAQKRLDDLKAAHMTAERSLAAHRDGRLLALAMQADAEREIERRRDGLGLERLRKELDKAKRRLHGVRVYNGLGGEPPTPEAA